MLYQLRNLSKREQDIAMKAPIWVTLLIACSDENLNAVEIDKSKEVIKIRSFAEHNDVQNLYKELLDGYEHRVQEVLDELSLEGNERLKQLEERLLSLNPVLAKLEHTYALQYYKGLKKLALNVAQSDGGLFGIGTVSDKEAELIELPMIQKP